MMDTLPIPMFSNLSRTFPQQTFYLASTPEMSGCADPKHKNDRFASTWMWQQCRRRELSLLRWSPSQVLQGDASLSAFWWKYEG